MKKILILFLAVTLLTGCTSIENKSQEETPNPIEKKEIQEETLIEDSTSPISSEEDFTTYLEEVEKDVAVLTTKETITPSEENTLKNTFITLTDFIFYEGTIKGVTFAELTDTAKVKVLELYSSIDERIEEKLPNYKEKIKDTTKKTYSDIKSKLAALKENLKDSYKESIGEDRYNSQVETFEEQKEIMKDSFEPLIDVITEKSTDIYESTKESFNNWYQEWKRK